MLTIPELINLYRGGFHDAIWHDLARRPSIEAAAQAMFLASRLIYLGDATHSEILKFSNSFPEGRLVEPTSRKGCRS